MQELSKQMQKMIRVVITLINFIGIMAETIRVNKKFRDWLKTNVLKG